MKKTGCQWCSCEWFVFLCDRVQAAQQHLQTLQAQYPHLANGAHYMEGTMENGAMMEMAGNPQALVQHAPQQGMFLTELWLR